jgi:hypothetical protein
MQWFRRSGPLPAVPVRMRQAHARLIRKEGGQGWNPGRGKEKPAVEGCRAKSCRAVPQRCGPAAPAPHRLPPSPPSQTPRTLSGARRPHRGAHSPSGAHRPGAATRCCDEAKCEERRAHRHCGQSEVSAAWRGANWLARLVVPARTAAAWRAVQRAPVRCLPCRACPPLHRKLVSKRTCKIPHQAALKGSATLALKSGLLTRPARVSPVRDRAEQERPAALAEMSLQCAWRQGSKARLCRRAEETPAAVKEGAAARRAEPCCPAPDPTRVQQPDVQSMRRWPAAGRGQVPVLT